MTELDEFKKKLGKESESLSDEEIFDLYKHFDHLADHLFSLWAQDFKEDKV